MKLHELTCRQFPLAVAPFQGALDDPLLLATLEGRRPIRVWVDHPVRSRAAFVWTRTECAYAASDRDDGSIREAVRQWVEGLILPALREAGREYLSLFAFPNRQAEVREVLRPNACPGGRP